MAHRQNAPYVPQDRQDVAEMLRGLQDHIGGKNSKKGKDKGFSCKKATFAVEGTDIKVDSWRMQDWDYKKPHLPTYARGLFTAKDRKGQPEIVTRGYDKFFNYDEVRETEWRNVETNTRGPYELSVKENGCIIFISGLEDGTLLVCSKHSTGYRLDTDVSHAKAGEQWVDRQLAGIGKTRQDLALKLREMNATAVAELCDDEFEEHVLEYTPETAGLYLHGINLNLPDFVTYPHHLIDKFAEEWGFRKTIYVIEEDITKVKSFLDDIAQTGNYAGRDTEGFVIRCQKRGGPGDEWQDWFFKYKFEEPYLMYRQWRECTKAIIAGKEPRYKKHKKITEEYLLFARKQLHKNPQLGKEYNANHGIIKMRDDFLAERGLKGSDIIRQEAEGGEVSSDAVTKDVVLVPVATIGCGKTTVALGLVKLFGWGHVQNDNITVKSGKPRAFAMACVNALAAESAMIADRNNHQRRERKQLIEDVSHIIPNARFVALHYVHERSNFDNIREKTRERVLTRGDNHQTIQAASKGDEIIWIMEGFMKRFEPVVQDQAPDDGFDLVIYLDPCASSRENLEHVINKLYEEYPKLFGETEMPSSEDMDSAVDFALSDYTVDIKHDIKSRDNRNDRNRAKQQPTGPSNGSAKAKEKKLEYFAVQLPAPRVTAILEASFRDTSPETARMYSILKQIRRVQSEFHVTLIHRASANEDNTREYWTKLSDLHAKASAPTEGRDYAISEPKIGECKVRLERLVWNDRVMAFVVRLIPVDGSQEQWTSTNATAHVTVGTASANIKPFESNALLSRWLQEGCGENGIMELGITGQVELEGTVRGILQKH